MKLIRNVFELEPAWEGSVITLGTFDGFHKGHQSLLRKLSRYGQKYNLPTVLVTYHPNPAIVVRPSKNASEIYSQEEKVSLLQEFNPDFGVMIEFTKELSQKSAHWFLKEVLLARLKAKCIIIGYDHTFGRGRKGNYKFLKDRQTKYDYDVVQVKPVRLFGITASSTAIRGLIAEGNMAKAARFLGRPYFITATVIKGKQLGRQIGFPTANLFVPDNKLIPALGVYVGVACYGEKFYRAMINVGQNPTFEKSGSIHIEAHLLDFNENLYGKQLRVYFTKRIRDEKKFAGVPQLKAQLERDLEKAAKVSLKRYELL